jgi:hypothetical protein
MKNVIIAIISLALLGIFSGCMHHGGGYVSGSYSDGCPSPYSCHGDFYSRYPWPYPFGFF